MGRGLSVALAMVAALAASSLGWSPEAAGSTTVHPAPLEASTTRLGTAARLGTPTPLKARIAEAVDPDRACRSSSTNPPPAVIQQTRAVRLPGGVTGLRVSWMPPPASPPIGIVGTWTPAKPIPALQTARTGVVIFYSPHPDDETLSMAPLIRSAVREHRRVIVVAMTDGLTTGAIKPVNARLRAAGYAPVNRAGIGRARIAEFRKAVAALGVAQKDVFLAHLDTAASDCGAKVSVREAHDVMAWMAARYPNATSVTMSDVAERNIDHLACGIALRQLVTAHTVRSASWTVSRLWWSLPSPRATWALPANADDRRRLAAADAAYSTWDPKHQSYAIGLSSVKPQFIAAERDPRARVHH